MPPRQLLKNQKSKTMKRLRNCPGPGKQSNLAKTCGTNKSVTALKKEIMCLKRNYSAVKLQLQEQKLEYATLNRKYVLLETEAQQLQMNNAALKEENRQYEKLIGSTEPEIRACMTQMVQTSQTLAGLQMAFNRHRSRQQLSKIGGSLSKTQTRTHPTMSKSSVKHGKNVLNVAPRRKQAVRPMVQGLQIFTNLTIPLQRISLPNQVTRRLPVPVVEAPQESEVVNIAVEPERPNSLSFEKHRRNLHFVKNIKSKAKHFGVKKDEARHPKGDLKRSGSICMVPELNFDDSSESEPEVKRFMKPIVLIRDFNIPSTKSGMCNAAEPTITTKTTPLQSFKSEESDISLHDPLEGTSKMYLSNSNICGTKRKIKPTYIRRNYISDSDSDSESVSKKSERQTAQESEASPSEEDLLSAKEDEGETSQCHRDTAVCQAVPLGTSNIATDIVSDVVRNLICASEMNPTETSVSETPQSCEALQGRSDEHPNMEQTQNDVEMQTVSDA